MVVQMSKLLTFVETGVFTKRMSALGLEESLRGLQVELLDNPEAGDIDLAPAVSARYGSAIRLVARASAEAPASITCGCPIGAAFI